MAGKKVPINLPTETSNPFLTHENCINEILQWRQKNEEKLRQKNEEEQKAKTIKELIDKISDLNSRGHLSNEDQEELNFLIATLNSLVE